MEMHEKLKLVSLLTSSAWCLLPPLLCSVAGCGAPPARVRDRGRRPRSPLPRIHRIRAAAPALEQSLGGAPSMGQTTTISPLLLQGKPRGFTHALGWTSGPSALLPHNMSCAQCVQLRQTPAGALCDLREQHGSASTCSDTQPPLSLSSPWGY